MPLYLVLPKPRLLFSIWCGCSTFERTVLFILSMALSQTAGSPFALMDYYLSVDDDSSIQEFFQRQLRLHRFHGLASEGGLTLRQAP